MQFVYLAVGGNQVILHENSKILQSFETIESLFTFKCLLLQNIEQKSIDKSNCDWNTKNQSVGPRLSSIVIVKKSENSKVIKYFFQKRTFKQRVIISNRSIDEELIRFSQSAKMNIFALFGAGPINWFAYEKILMKLRHSSFYEPVWKRHFLWVRLQQEDHSDRHVGWIIYFRLRNLCQLTNAVSWLVKTSRKQLNTSRGLSKTKFVDYINEVSSLN